eukprot:2756169-Pyramimonas_sp.AAC.2
MHLGNWCGKALPANRLCPAGIHGTDRATAFLRIESAHRKPASLSVSSSVVRYSLNILWTCRYRRWNSSTKKAGQLRCRSLTCAHLLLVSLLLYASANTRQPTRVSPPVLRVLTGSLFR